MTFGEYVQNLNAYLKENPDSAELKVFISNGYCTSEEFVQVRRKPHTRKMIGKMAKRFPGDVVMLV